jgi:hypothetical protein
MMIPLATFLDDTNNGHSGFQIDHFITIRSGGTLYGCYHQACRELSSRVSALADCLSSIAETEIKLDRSDAKARSHPSPHRRDLAHVKSQRLRFTLGQLTHRLTELRNEFIRFYAQSAALYSALGFDRERPTPQRLAELEAERWEHHLRCQIAVELFTQGRPGRNTAEALQSLPASMRKRIGDDCLSSEEAQRRAIAWYFDYSPDIPAPLALSEIQQQELISCCESSLSPKRLPPSSPTAAKPSPPINTASDWKSATDARSGAASAAQNADVSSP